MTNGFYAYDIEVSPNFFSATFVPLNGDEVFDFVIHESRDDRENLAGFLHEVKGLVGFNNLYYDTPIIRYFLIKHDEATFHSSWMSVQELTRELYRVSVTLIQSSDQDEEEIRELRFYLKSDWKDLDLMKIQAFDKLGVGLKQVAINLRWHRIQDLPFHYSDDITTEQIEMVLDYNLNDVLITKALYQRLQPEIKLRKDIGKVYGVDVINASDSKIANILLESMITDNPNELKNIQKGRTSRDVISIKECIPPDLNFVSPEFQQLISDLKSTKVYEKFNFSFKKSVVFKGVEYQLGIGGLHSVDSAAIFTNDNDMVLRDADVASFYPNIVLNLGIRPQHLGERFNTVFRQMTDDRIKAKKSGDKVKADGLKITINSTFGKFGSEHFWLYDPLALLKVTIAGQLYLLKLIEMLAYWDIQTVSANTDGVLCYFPKEKEIYYDNICDGWQVLTKFELEMTDYKKYVRRDVNNYLAIKTDGKLKAKGIFAKVEDLRKGFKMPVVQKALENYFVKGISVNETLTQTKDILDYALAQKTGRQFTTEYHTRDGVKTMQKNNRYAVSTKGGSLLKRKESTGKLTSLVAGEMIVILNDIKDQPFEDYNIDLNYYRKEINKIINVIEPSVIQMSLF